ncbi:MAG: polysaccharide deacetylase family protein [Aggregatilineales bacterium]
MVLPTITMAQMWHMMLNLEPAPEKPVVLTFDDGYWDAYGNAARLMLEREMIGVFYVVSDFVNQPGFLTAAQVGELHNLGFEIGNHSQTHSDMSWMNTSEQQRIEIETAGEVLAGITGQYPTTFCYPRGKHNSLAANVLEKAGYHTAVTTSDATLHFFNNPHYMGRVRMRPTTEIPTLNWLVNRVS